MSDAFITLACYDYDRALPLLRGDVKVEGFTIAPVELPAEQVFPRALERQEFDVAELSAGSYLIQAARRESAYVAIPVFISRAFRHGAIYIRTDRGIAKPKDLEGKLVGIPSYQFTAVMWARGILQDEYGVDFRTLRYRVGGTNIPGQSQRPPLALSGIELLPVGEARSLSDLLAVGELDAVISPDIPDAFRKDASRIARLFPDFAAEERRFYAKTGFFPIMHVIGIRRDVAERHLNLPAALFHAFAQSKTLALSKLRAIALDSANRLTLPWLGAEFEATAKLAGENFWRYGVAPNRAELETMCRYAHEQQMASRRPSVEELFHPTTVALEDEAPASAAATTRAIRRHGS